LGILELLSVDFDRGTMVGFLDISGILIFSLLTDRDFKGLFLPLGLRELALLVLLHIL